MEHQARIQPAQQQGCSLVTLAGYVLAFAVMCLVINWGRQRWDWLGLIMMLAAPLLGLLTGGVMIILFARLFVLIGCMLSADFRREIRASRNAVADDIREQASLPDQTDLPS